jgi:hypothetical protein
MHPGQNYDRLATIGSVEALCYIKLTFKKNLSQVCPTLEFETKKCQRRWKNEKKITGEITAMQWFQNKDKTPDSFYFVDKQGQKTLVRLR